MNVEACARRAIAANRWLAENDGYLEEFETAGGRTIRVAARNLVAERQFVTRDQREAALVEAVVELCARLT